MNREWLPPALEAWDRASAPIWVTGPEGGCTYCNESLLAFLGATREQTLGFGWMEHVHPEDRRASAEAFEQAFAERLPFLTEHRFLRHDGAYRWIAVSGSPWFSPEGKLAGFTGVWTDIHECKAAHEALKQSQNQYSSVITAMAEGVLVVDPEGRIAACNPAAETICGVPRDRLLGYTILHSFPNLITKSGKPCRADRCPIESTLRTGKPHRDVVFGLVQADGSRTWISMNTQPLDQDGPDAEPPYAVVATLSDITERRRVEEELRYQATVLSEVSEAVIAVDATGAIRLWNAGAERLLLRKASDALGKRIDEALPVGKMDSTRAEIRATLAEAGHWRGQTTWVKADGSTFWADMSAVHIRGAQGQVQGAVVSVRDLTKLRQAEEALRRTASDFKTLFDAGPVPAFLVDMETCGFVAVNDAAVSAYGYSREEFREMTIWDIRPAEEVERIRAHIREHGRWPESGVWQHRRKDGGIREVEITARWVEYEGRQARLCLAQDVTAQRRTARALQEAVEKAEQANRAKGEFLASMSHEIRTPMNGILGMTRLLLDSQLTKEQRENLETVLSSAHNLMQLLNDILDASKIEAGKIELEKVEFDLRTCLEQVAGILGQAAREKGIGLAVHYPPETPRLVRGDPTRVRQIVLNFASNAVKFTEAGYVLLEAEASPLGGGRYRFNISVHDTGIGIAQTKLPALFERFSQADTSTTRRFGGTGLGLAIAKELAELMGGEIRVTSREGEGSAFTASLPMAAIPNAPKEKPNPVQFGPVLPAGIRILVVEDNPVNQRVACRLLEKQGCRVDLAANGLEAVRMTAESRYELVLMDCQMPEMDGFEATRRIREREGMGPRVPIVAMTAYAMKGDRERCLEAGMDDYISKPIQPSGLYRTVAEWWMSRHREAVTSGS